MKSYPKTDKDIAAYWGVAMRTFFRWKGEQAPISDYAAMCQWLATRKNLPRAVLEKIKVPAPENVSSAAGGGTAGAASALKRLETSELQAFERMQTALTRGNPLEIREARENWLKISESLRKFDLLVEANRRDAGELVPVSETGKFLRSFISWTVTATTLQSEHVVNELIGKEAIEMYAVIRQLCGRSIFMAATAYCKGVKNGPDPRLVEYAEKCH